VWVEDCAEIIVATPHVPLSPTSRALIEQQQQNESQHNSDGLKIADDAYAVSTRRGMRRHMQDTFCCEKPRSECEDPDCALCSLPVFFGVFDGHGACGAKISQLSADEIPKLFFNALKSPPSSHFSELSTASTVNLDDCSNTDSPLPATMSHSTSSSLSTSPNILAPSLSTSTSTSCLNDDTVISAFHSSFNACDKLVCSESELKGGSTAVCAYVSTHPETGEFTLHVANVGDSQALLMREGNTWYPLTEDHRCQREDERIRVERAGAAVVYASRALRVNGVLNVTRSIGDVNMKDVIISQPECRTVSILDTDEYLLMASDGVISALTPDDLTDVVQECTIQGFAEARNRPRASEISEAVVEAALARRAVDNLCVVVVDLKQLRQKIEKAKKLHPAHSNYTKNLTSHHRLPSEEFNLGNRSCKNSNLKPAASRNLRVT
jgi:serine/threonine protein phosphatase PrpC